MTAPTPRAVLAVFSLTLIVSAAAMFAVQPMAGRMLLPLVGGTPTGWIVVMAFFQTLLLAGYLLAHLLSRFEPRVHALLYLAALGAGLFFLPPVLAAHAGLVHDTPGPFDVVKLLAVTLAVPFIGLSATSSTVQRLFTTTGHAAAKDPYFLYAASNLGSFAGLLAYPLLIEPNFTLTQQSRGWQGAYIALILCVALCLLMSGSKQAKKPAEKAAPVTRDQRLLWLILAFFPSSLLMGVTTYITTDVISVPMVWVIPLSIYLLAFVAAFARRPPVTLRTTEILLMPAVAAAVLAIAYRQAFSGLGAGMVLLHMVCFSVFALYCNTRLAQMRPSGARLTEFYLILSLGGALGGIFNAFAAPNIFVRVIEYPLCLLALPLLLPKNGPKTRMGAALIAVLGLMWLLANHPPAEAPAAVVKSCLMLMGLLAAAVIAMRHVRKGWLFPVLGGVLLISTHMLSGSTVYMTRNFFGALRVFEGPAPGGGTARYFLHGTTLHGFQVKGKETSPTAYYTVKGPFGDTVRAYNPKRIAVIGLGTGAINCMTAPGRTFTFIDIDPDVIDIAKSQFSYLTACPAPHLVIGDGRLEMSELKGEKFDMIVIDAFSSDSIPVHLLTREAFVMYLGRLGPKGVIAIHISNRHFKLQTPVAATTDSMSLQIRYASSAQRKNMELWATKSAWLIVSRHDLAEFAKKYGWEDIPRDASFKPWTDDYTNLLSALNYGG